MRRISTIGSRFSHFVVASMLLSPLMQSPSLGEEPDIRKEAAPVRDVQLGAEGRLEVAIVDKAGKPVASKLVRVEFKGHAIAYAHTDRDGHIVVRGLRPGVHTVATVGQKPHFGFGMRRQRLRPPCENPPS